MSNLAIRPSFSQLKKRAKSLCKDTRAGLPEALARLRAHHPDYAAAFVDLSLREAQLAIARECGVESWSALKEKVEGEAQKDSREQIAAQRIRQQTSSAEEIERIIRAASGSGVQRSERITRGFSCEVHHVTTTDGQELMYRANWYNPKDDSHFENEKWALLRCEASSVPAPRFRHIEHELPGHPYRSVIVATRVTGKPLKQLVDEEALSATELCDLLRETGAIYGKLHQISTDGFGHLDAQGKGQRKDWYAAHLGNLDLKRLRQSSDNAGLPWSLVEEGLKLGKKNAGLGDGIAPCLQQGDFKLEHIIVDQGHVSGLIDFEYCRGDDPADEAGWSGELNQGSWWDAFTGETSSAFPTQPLVEGYRQTGTIDAGFQTRRHWLNFCHGLGGLCYHGINDINTAGMMDFLHWRYREDLAITKRHLS